LIVVQGDIGKILEEIISACVLPRESIITASNW